MRSKDNKYVLNNGVKFKDKLYSLHFPLIMGVLNLTPDSFYKESRKNGVANALKEAEEMVTAGVNIIDVGGVSTRPGADLLSAEEELKRVLPVIKEVRKCFPQLLISIDTFRSSVAVAAVEAGADMVNDVYGGRYDEQMFDTIAKLNVPYVLMHSRGDASNMQELCDYNDVVTDVVYELSLTVNTLREKGVKDIIIDPGFGFAKDLAQNYELLQGISYFEVLDCPLLVGISRKSMIYKLFDSSPKDSLNGTTVLNTFALLNQAGIIRVHDVKEAIEVRTITQALIN